MDTYLPPSAEVETKGDRVRGVQYVDPETCHIQSCVNMFE